MKKIFAVLDLIYQKNDYKYTANTSIQKKSRKLKSSYNYSNVLG